MLRHYLSSQFLGFIGVGITAALFNWLARIFLGSLMPFEWAVVLAYGIGMSLAFILNALYVFPGSSEPRSLQAMRFTAINLAFLPVVWASSLMFLSLLTWIGLQKYVEELAHAVALATPMLATFLLYKFFAFKANSRA